MTIAEFEQAFEDLDMRIRKLLAETPEQLLFVRPHAKELSVGEKILRSAAAVEQVAGGLTTRLWDDPFEWTLPEKLHSKPLILDYLDEVDEARRRAFGFFRSNDDLQRSIPAPAELKTIGAILSQALMRSDDVLGD